MSTERNTQVVRAYYEQVLTARRLELLEELFDVTFRNGGPQYVRDHVVDFVGTWPDCTFQVLETIASGDDVFIRVTMRATQRGTLVSALGPVKPSGKQVEVDGWFVYRLRNAKIVESIYLVDRLGMLQQLEAIALMG